MRILTFNHHEPYLCSLAALDHHFDVVVKVGSLDLSWNTRSQPVPSNMRLISFDATCKQALKKGEYDVVICHTVKNLLWLFPYRRPSYIFVAHIPLFWHTPLLAMKSLAKKLLYLAFAFTHCSIFLAVSVFKKNSWGLKGPVVILSPKEFPELIAGEGYGAIAVVCNQLLERREELGLEMLEVLRRSFPIHIIGNNPGVSGAIKPRDFSDFTETFRKHRIYLYTIRFPYGDGYNTAMLEAMRLGMAVVTIENPSSPIVHGTNGLVGRNIDELATHLARLLNDPALVDRLGKAARETIAQHFHESKFIEGWQGAINEAADTRVSAAAAT